MNARSIRTAMRQAFSALTTHERTDVLTNILVTNEVDSPLSDARRRALDDLLPLGVWTVDLGVSKGRPYVLDEWRTYQVEARDSIEAGLIACQIACCTAMPVTRGYIRSVRF